MCQMSKIKIPFPPFLFYLSYSILTSCLNLQLGFDIKIKLLTSVVHVNNMKSDFKNYKFSEFFKCNMYCSQYVTTIG